MVVSNAAAAAEWLLVDAAAALVALVSFPPFYTLVVSDAVILAAVGRKEETVDQWKDETEILVVGVVVA